MTSPQRRHAAIALAVYVLLIAVQGRLVLQHASDHLASDAGDPALNLAILTWTADHTPLSRAWWDFPGFHPLPATLTLSEHLAGLLPLAAPAMLALDRPVLVYNVLFLLSFVASAMAAYALAFSLTQRADAAFLAGLVFGFAPYRAAHLAHLQMLSAYWMPLSLLALHRYLATGRVAWAAIGAAAWLLQGLTSSYALVHFSLLIGLWVLWFVLWPRRWRALAVIGGMFVLAGLVLVPLVRQYVAAHAALGLRRDILEITAFGADVLSMLDATARLSVWGWVQFFDRPEGELFPGVALPILLLAGAVAWWRGRSVDGQPHRRRRIRLLLMGGAVVAATAAVSVWLVGPWAVEIGPARISSSGIHKPATLALALLLVAIGTGPLWRSAIGRSSAMGFYAAAAIVTWLLALGPGPKLGGILILSESPYTWLLSVPGADRLRVPARFWLMTLLCLTVVAATLFVRLTSGLSTRRRMLVTAVAASGLMVDGWTTIPVVAAPGPISILTQYGPGSNVLETPLGDLIADAAAQYRAVVGGWRTFNGYSGYSPPHYLALQRAIESTPGETLELLRSYGPLTVSVDTARDPDGHWTAMVGQQSAARHVASSSGVVVFQFPAGSPRRIAASPAPEVPMKSVTAPCSPRAAPLVLDGDLATNWECGQSEGTPELLVELEEDAVAASLIEWSGRQPGDPSARLQVDTSLDGSSWERAWEGPIAAAALDGSLSDPTGNPVHIRFAPRLARFVRLRQSTGDAAYRWWVAELQINAR